MANIVLPKKVNFISGEDNSGQIVIEPCYPGYGTTLGNAFRRVLLSSLTGAAVVGVKFKNASHEFTTIDNVKEDVLEIILNLKNLRMKIHSDDEEVIKLELKSTGEKKVTAKEITKNSNVEIMNPELHIAEVTDKKGELDMEICIAKGTGYTSIESREESIEKEVGYIDVDSIFSPIKLVKVEIEDVRVSKMTNWEKLIIDIKTDGSIDFKEAFKQSAEILENQLSFLLEQTKEKKKEDKETKEKEVKVEKVEEEDKEDKEEKIKEEK